jgi:hypothetical protein
MRRETVVLRVVAVIAWAVLGAAGAEAQVSAQTRRTHAAAVSAWGACDVGPTIPELPHPDDYGDAVRVRRTPRGFRVDGDWGGQGVEATYGGLSLRLEPRGCRALWAKEHTYDGALAIDVRVSWVNRVAPTAAELASLVAPAAEPDDPRDAFARAWLVHACRGGPDSCLEWSGAIEGPIAPAQPWHEGRLQRQRRSLWAREALAAIGATDRLPASDAEGLGGGDGGPEILGVVVPMIGRPRRTFSGAGVVLYESELPSRNGGRAIAIWDPERNRHRWVVATRGAVQGTTVAWAGVVGDHIVGVTSSRHGAYEPGDAILILDVPSGTAWAVRFPGVAGLSNDSSQPRRGRLVGTVLTIETDAPLASVDLAPLVAEISRRAR